MKSFHYLAAELNFVGELLQENDPEEQEKLIKYYNLRRDMRIVTEIATAFGEIMLTLTQDLPQEVKPPSFEAFLPMLFGTAKLVAWTDISLREKRFGEIINHLRSELPIIIRRDLTEQKKREIAELSPQFALMIERSLTELEETFKNKGAG